MYFQNSTRSFFITIMTQYFTFITLHYYFYFFSFLLVKIIRYYLIIWYFDSHEPLLRKSGLCVDVVLLKNNLNVIFICLATKSVSLSFSMHIKCFLLNVSIATGGNRLHTPLTRMRKRHCSFSGSQQCLQAKWSYYVDFDDIIALVERGCDTTFIRFYAWRPKIRNLVPK